MATMVLFFDIQETDNNNNMQAKALDFFASKNEVNYEGEKFVIP